MAINLVLSQVVGQAFVVKPNGEVVQAQPNTVIEPGDVVSVSNGNNAWLVTQDQEQIDVLDEALLATEDGLEGLDLPSDIADIIAAIESGADPTQQEGTETAAGETSSGSALTSQGVIEGSSYTGDGVYAGFDTTGLEDAGLTTLQIDALGSARYGDLFTTLQEPVYVPPTLSGIDIAGEEDGEIILSRDDILGAISGGDADNIRIVGISTDVEGVTIADNGDGSYTLIPPPDYNGEIPFTVEVTDGTTTLTGDVNVTVTAVEDIPEVTITPIDLVEDENVSEGSPVATISTRDGDGDTLTVQIVNDPNGYFRLEGDTIVLTEAGAAAIDDDILNLSEITVTVSVSDGKTTVEESAILPITRTDDDATLEGDLSGDVTDSTGTVPASVSGTLTVVDPDSNNETTLVDGVYEGEYGTLVVENGAWTYTVDKDAVAPLAEGEQGTDVITISASDGSTHQIVLNVEGTNDPALISGDISATIIDNSGTMQANGQLTSTDVDGEDNTFIAETIPTLRGELTINENGSWSYVSSDPTGAIKALGEGETLTEYVTVQSADGTEQQIEITFQGVNDAAVFSAISTGEVTESDSVMSTHGTINVEDADKGESFMQSGIFDGIWGTVEIDAAGNWTYTTRDSSHDAIQSLTDGEKLTDTITVYSVDGTETQITITINGTNDDAIIGGDIAATIIDNSGTMTTSGTLTSTDIDGNDNKFIVETLPTLRGEVTIDENGNWTYTTTDPTGAIQRLPEGETLTEVVTVRAEDGTEQQIVITLEGINDTPVFSAISSRDVYEANDVISVNGTINILDPDLGESFMLAGTYMGEFGSVAIDRAGNWTYTSDPAQSASLDTLIEGETRVDTITVRSVDGTETELKVTIIGTNDPAQIAGDIVGTIVEADGTMSTSGQLTSTDVDGNDNTFTPQTVIGRWGELTIDADGNWTYSSNDEKGAINRLGDGDQLTDTISVRSEDGTVQKITITIDGTNDTAVFGGKTQTAINETDGVLTTQGRATVSDADYGEYFFQAGTYSGSYGEIVIDRAGNWSYTSDPSSTATFDALDAGDLLPESVTVYSLDGTPLEIQITIQGTNDLPVVSGQTGGSLTDTTSGDVQTLTGSIAISDVDADDNPTFDDVSLEGKYGSLELVDGEWTYTLNKDAAAVLNAGELGTDIITLVASDSTQQTLVFSITGTDDEPVLKGDTIGSLTDVGSPTTSGFIEIFDPDSEDSPTLPDSEIDGQYGTLVLVDGEWTYTLDPDSVASLPDGEKTTDVITITASDGSTHDITITITGTDQEPVLTGDTTGNVTEGSGVLTTSGSVDLIDVDEGDNPTLPNGTFGGQYGSLELVDGNWTYTLDPDLAQYLDEGQSTTDTISITASDGTVHDIVITITGSEDAAVLSGDTTGSVVDEVGSLTTSGSLTVSDPDATDNPSLPDTNQQGQFGTFTMVDGNWTYTLDPELAESLDEGVTVTDTITITDSMGGTHELVISVTGTEDAATLVGDTTGNLVEGVDTSVSGTLSLVDQDSGDTTTFDNTTVEGQFGSLTLTDGEWTYTLTPGAAQSFGVGESTTDTITLTDSEGTEHQVVITIEGSDDAPIVTGDFTGAVTAQTGPTITVENLYVLGDDADGNIDTFSSDAQPDALLFNNAGFSATINDSDGALTSAAQGDTSQSITLDGVDYPIAVTATVEYSDAYGNTYTMGVLNIGESESGGYYGGGTAATTLLVQLDGPTIVPGTELALVEGSYTETSAIQYLNIAEDVTTSGSISISDPDANDNPVFADTTIEGNYGTFSLVGGEWTYTLDPDKAAPLTDGQVVQDVFTLTASDDTQQQITISVTGSDDAAYISGDLTASITDDGTAGSVTGSITITDPDATTPPTLPNGDTDGDYGTLTLVDGEWTYTIDPDKAATIPGDDTVTDTITLVASDGTEHVITLSVTGTDNAAVVSGVTSGAIDLGDAADTSLSVSTSGTLTITDVDEGENPSFADTNMDGSYGSLALVDGTWIYTTDPAKAQTIDDGDVKTETFTLTASDGTQQVITVTVTGTDEAPVVSGDTSATLSEDSATQQVTGSISISDVDAGDTPVFADTTVDGTYGSLALVNGTWTYTLNDNAQTLGAGESAQDVITLTASDGTQQEIVITVTGADDLSVITGATTGSVTEGDIGDVITTSGTLSVSDTDGDAITLPNDSQTGNYGSFELVDGSWTYTLDNTKADSLAADEVVTDVFTVTASDGSTQQVTVTITGTDDASYISGDLTASITDDGTASSVMGSITITDPDAAVAPTLPNGDTDGDYGTLTLVDGEWTYTIDPDKAATIPGDDTVTDTITLVASDGTEHVITLSVTGTDNAAVVSGVTAGAIDLGDAADTTQAVSTSGTLTITDVDEGESPSFANTNMDGSYGSLSLVDGTWTYTTDPAKAQTIDDGDVKTETFTLTASDGTQQVITVTVTGTDEAPVVSGDTRATLSEDSATQQVTGSITISDVDAGDTPVFADTTVDGSYGSLSLVNGTWTYTLNDNAQTLGAGESAQEVITLTASDGTQQEIVITVTGADDLSVITGATTGSVTEGDIGDVITTSGTLSVTDTDGDAITLPNDSQTGNYGSFELVDGTWTYTLDNAKADSLAADQVVTDVFTVTASDGSTQQVTVTITGTDDASYISGDLTASITDDGTASSVTGSITITDPDATTPPTLPNGDTDGDYGTLTLVDGEWTYTIDPDKAATIPGDDTVTDTITLVASDGTEHVITLSVTGTDNAAVVSGVTSGAIDLGDAADTTQAVSTSGTLTITDVDEGENPSFANTNMDGAYGSLSLVDGTWTYTTDPAKAQTIDDGDVKTETFTLTASDGTQQVITVTVTGTDEAPVVSGDTSATLSEDSATQQVTGSISISDVDAGDSPVFADTTVEGSYGSLTLVNGTWTYTLNDNAQTLGAGESAQDVITLTASDGTQQEIVITVTGADDLSVITGATTGAVTEGDIGDVITTSGTLSVSDTDGDAITLPNDSQTGNYGSFELVDGTWTYTLDNTKADSLAVAEVVTDVFTVTASDGSTQQVTVTITGTDDASYISGDLTASITDDGTASSVTGSITITDPDATVAPTLPNGDTDGDYGTLTLVDGEWTYTLNPDKAATIPGDDTVTDTITLTASDGTEHVVTISVTGTDNAAVVSGVTAGAIDLGDAADTSLSVSTSGTLTITDVDEGENPNFADTNMDGAYGSLSLVDGTWTYTTDPAKAQTIDDGDVKTETFTLTASDGTQQVITVTVTGTDEAPVVSGDTSATISEDSATQQVTGSITISDVDAGDSPVFADTTVDGTYGSLALVNGTWTYTLNDNAQTLGAGEAAQDVITLTASDGTQQEIVITVTGADDLSVITGATAGSVTEGDIGDVITTSGTLSVSDTDGDAITLPNDSQTGNYGNFELVDGTWTYTLDNAKADSLAADEVVTDVFTVTASDGSTQQVTVTITGTDDASYISGDLTASITDDGTASSVTGSITITDPDATTPPTLPNGDTDGDYGTLTLVDGEWTYTIDPDKAATIPGDDTVSDTITLVASDGTEHVITLSVTGTDNAAVVSGVTSGAIDLGDAADTSLSVSTSGTLTITDVDEGENPSFADTNMDGSYGSLALVDGTWIYTTNPAKAQTIDDGDVKTETFTLTASDGTQQVITVTVTGTDEAPVVSGDTSATISEDSATQQVTGSITISDVDAGDSPVFADTTVDGTYGSLALVNGTWTYTLNDNAQTLGAGESAQEVITLTASDGTQQEIVITVTGADDLSVITGATTGAVTEGDVGDVITTSGTLSVSDTDGDAITLPNDSQTGNYGSFELVDGTWTYTLDNAKADSLAADEVVTDVFTVTASDGSTQQVTVTITGTDDASYISGDLTASITDDGTASSVTGSITITDPDATTPPTLPNGDTDGDYGTLTLVDGEWTYTIDPDKAATIPGDDTITDTITLVASDGTEHVITLSVTGTDNAAVVSGVTSGAIDLGDAADTSLSVSTSGTLTITDVDEGENPSFADTNMDGSYGSLSLVDGTWTYTTDPAKAQTIDDGDVKTETFTLTASDGTQQVITVTVTGTDEAPVVSGDTSATISEDSATQQVTGSISISDVDAGDTPVFADTTVDGTYGSLALVNGTWTYTLNDNAQTLGAGEAAQDVITLTASDGTQQEIVITVTGADDLSVITGATTGSVTEGDIGDVITTSGTLSVTDTDGDAITLPNDSQTGNYGSFELVDGTWTYTLDNTKADSLAAEEVVTDVFTVTASDGSTQQVTVTITGTDDASYISGDLTASITDDGTASSVTGSITITDPDATVAPTLPNGDTDGDYGTLTLVDGEWTYTIDPDKAATIPGDDTITDTITLVASDGTEHVITLSVTGTDNAAVVSGVTSGAIDLGDAADTSLSVSTSGTLTITDVDEGENPSFADTNMDGSYGSLSLVDGTWTYTTDPAKAQTIDDGDVKTETFTLTASDGTQQVITVTVTGTDEAPVVSGDTSATLSEDSATQQVTGSITISDVDAGDTPVFADTTVDGTYGSLALVNGTWTYTLNDNAQTLGAGEAAQDVITLTASDGTQQEIVITVTGADDLSVITATTTGAVTEGDVGDVITTSGTLSVSDTDGDAITLPNDSQTGNYGSFELVDGTWTYTLDNTKADSLNQGELVSETFTVTASDGSTQDVVVNITGTDDAAVLSGTNTGTITDVTPSTENATLTRSADGTWDVSDGNNLYLNISNVGSEAAYNNSVGYYVLDADGNVLRSAIIFDNAHYTSGTSINIDTSGGEKVGLFMIPDGDSLGFNVGSVSLSFGSNGVYAYQGGASGTAFVSESSKNGGFDYEVNSGTYSGWEDLSGGGDQDYNDVTFYVTATQQQDQPISASGNISVSDVDSGDNPVLPNTTMQGEYGTLILNNGYWEYTFDQSNAQRVDEESVETFVITDSEGNQHEIVIAIQGSDDAPIVTGVFTGAVTEGDFGDDISVSGTLTISDPDESDTPEFINTELSGSYGTLTLEDGVWTYNLDPVKAEVLSSTDYVNDVFTLTATDGTTQDINISITGTNDEPFIVGTNSATLVAPDSSTRDYVDIDNVFWLGDGYSFSAGNMQYVGSEPPTLDFSKSATTARIYDTDSLMDGDGTDAMGTNEYVYDTTQKVEINGVLYNVNFDYTINYQDSAGNVYSFAVVDIDLDHDRWHNSDPNEQGNFIIQMSGPTITPGTQLTYLPNSVVRDGNLTYQELAVETAAVQASGSLAVVDVDANDQQPVFANTTINGQYGTLVLENGNWTYTLDPRSTPTLGDNDTVSEVITLTANNGYQTQVNVTIGGSDTAIAQASPSGLSHALTDVISLDDVTFEGTASNDRIAGSSADDVIVGNDGNDIIHGNLGSDIIDGGLGDDLIIGGQGNDLLVGGLGSDTFAFLQGDQGSVEEPAVDHIADFDTQQDTINLSDLMSADNAESLEGYLSLIDDGEGHAVLNISTQGDGNVDQQVVFDNVSLDDMAAAYAVDTSGLTTEQISASVIDAMVMQSRMIID